MTIVQLSIFAMIVSIIFFLYLIPSYVATKRKHKNVMAIRILNVFVGWTGFGWVAALVWAFISQDQAK